MIQKSIAMKVIILTSLLALLLAPELKAQASPPVHNNVKVLNPGKGYMNSLNTRALRDFLKKYENAADVVWYAVKDGFVVRFRVDSTHGRSAYDKRGQWIYTIKQYSEKFMPRDVRHIVKSSYYDYAITLVEEIEQPNHPVRYLVHMQDEVSWKNVLISDRNMELVEDKKKL